MSPLSRDEQARSRQLANLRPGARTAPAGNARARTHGAFARLDQGRLASKRAEVAEVLAADAPLRDEQGNLPRHDELAVSLLAETLTRLDSVRSFLDLHGLLTEKGEVRPAVEVEDRLIARAFGYIEALGMTPRSRAKLGLDTARSLSLADEMADAREARERAEQRLADEDTER